MALRILVQLFFLAHVGDAAFERAEASNPALRFILCGAAQIQAFPSSAEDHSEAVGLWNQTCHLSQTLRLTALPHTLHLRHTDWKNPHTQTGDWTITPKMIYIICYLNVNCVIYAQLVATNRTAKKK